MVYDVGNLEFVKRYGVVFLEGDRVVDFEEKLVVFKFMLISIGVYVFFRDVMVFIDEYFVNGYRDVLGYFFSWFLKKGIEIRVYCFLEFWYDIGLVDSYFEVFKILFKESYIEEI